MGFARSFASPPKFEEFKKQPECVKFMNEFYPQFGVLNYMALTKDKIITIERDKEDECMIPLTTVIVTQNETETIV